MNIKLYVFALLFFTCHYSTAKIRRYLFWYDHSIVLLILSLLLFFLLIPHPHPHPCLCLGEPSIPGQMHERFPGQQFTLYSIQIASVEFYFSISMILLAVYLHHEMYSLSPLIEELIDWFPNDNTIFLIAYPDIIWRKVRNYRFWIKE